MRMLVGALLAVSLAPAGAAAETRSEEWPYVAGADAATTCHTAAGARCYAATFLSVCTQGACTYADEGETVDIVLEDASGLPVGAFVEFVGDCTDGVVCITGPRTIEQHTMCGADSFVAPPGTEGVLVFVDGPAYGPVHCLGRSLGLGTVGTITLTFIPPLVGD